MLNIKVKKLIFDFIFIYKQDKTRKNQDQYFDFASVVNDKPAIHISGDLHRLSYHFCEFRVLN